MRMMLIMAFYACDVGDVSRELGPTGHLFILLASKTGGVLYLSGNSRSFIRNHSHLIIRLSV